MREISPVQGMGVDEYVAMLPNEIRQLVEEIRRKKATGARLHPSTSLIDHSALLTKALRNDLIDAVADLVDENYIGRAEMCLQFADLLNRSLTHLRFPSRAVLGTAIYYDSGGKEIFRWKHAWVRIGDEVIDANVDSIGKLRIEENNAVCRESPVPMQADQFALELCERQRHHGREHQPALPALLTNPPAHDENDDRQKKQPRAASRQNPDRLL